MDTIYNKAFNEYLSKITNVINKNKELSYAYLDGLVGAMNDNNKIIQLLQNTPVNKKLPPALSCLYPTHAHCWKYTKFVDLISSKYKTQFYLNKYNIIKAKFENSKDFIIIDLHTNILQEYKKLTNNIKEILQTFKGNKISDKYPELHGLDSIDEHVGKLNNFYTNLNKFLSDDKFNNYYLPTLDKYISNKKNEIDNVEKYIEGRHDKIRPGKTSNSVDKDFCVSYIRKKTYTCNNGDIYEYEDSGEMCFESFYPDNYKNLVLPSFNADENLKKEFKDFIKSIRERIENYKNKIKKLKEDLISIDNTVLNEKITFGYLNSIKEKTNSILSQKFSDNLIQGSYNYYKGLLDKRLENVLNNASSEWVDSFNKLEENINNNSEKFKTSIQEFGLIALIYNSVISQNLTRGYYDSIINHQKSEFNYTISYYYNILLQNITSVYQSIFNQIPTNQEGLNNLLDLRKKEIKDKFDELIKIVKKSKEQSLSLDYQIYILNTAKTNFFKVDSILSKSNSELKTKMETKGNTILGLNNKINKRNDQFSLACKFYLENSIQFFQKTEFNYSITHYYDYFYKLVNKSYTYILANLPKEETEYNEYFMEMKNRTLIFFNLIFNNISESEDISEESKEKVSEKNLDDRFDEILNISENTISFVETNENFDTFREIVQKNLKKFHVSFKESQQIIKNVYGEDDDIYEILNDKLDELYKFGLNYYEELGKNFNSLEIYIKESLKEIDNLLNQCSNSTYEVIGRILEEISNQTESIDKDHNKEIEDVNPIETKIITQNGEFNTYAKVSSMKNKAKFEFQLISEEGEKLKRKRIINRVVNEIKPEKIEFKISIPIEGASGEIYYKIDVNFNNASYSKNINYDTKSSLLKGTTITDFESYTYTIAKYEVEKAEEKKCICILYICPCTKNVYAPNKIKTLEEPKGKKIDKRYNEESFEIM